MHVSRRTTYCHIQVCEVEDKSGGDNLTAVAAIKFNVTNVKKPLASASRVVAAGNRIVMDESGGGSYIENKETKEKMKLRVDRGVYVFDATYEDGAIGVITLDSGAGVHVMPMDFQKKVKMQPKQPGLKLSAANGSDIENYGTKTLKFKGTKPSTRPE